MIARQADHIGPLHQILHDLYGMRPPVQNIPQYVQNILFGKPDLIQHFSIFLITAVYIRHNISAHICSFRSRFAIPADF